MTNVNDHLKRAAESLDRAAEQHENHAKYLRIELEKAEAEGKQARTDAAEIRKSLGE